MNRLQQKMVLMLIFMLPLLLECSTGLTDEQMDKLIETRQATESIQQELSALQEEREELLSKLRDIEIELQRAVTDKARVEKIVKEELSETEKDTSHE